MRFSGCFARLSSRGTLGSQRESPVLEVRVLAPLVYLLSQRGVRQKLKQFDAGAGEFTAWFLPFRTARLNICGSAFFVPSSAC